MYVIHVWHSRSTCNITAKDFRLYVLLLVKHHNGASWRDTCSLRSLLLVPVLGAFSFSYATSHPLENESLHKSSWQRDSQAVMCQSPCLVLHEVGCGGLSRQPLERRRRNCISTLAPHSKFVGHFFIRLLRYVCLATTIVLSCSVNR